MIGSALLAGFTDSTFIFSIGISIGFFFGGENYKQVSTEELCHLGYDHLKVLGVCLKFLSRYSFKEVCNLVVSSNLNHDLNATLIQRRWCTADLPHLHCKCGKTQA